MKHSSRRRICAKVSKTNLNNAYVKKSLNGDDRSGATASHQSATDCKKRSCIDGDHNKQSEEKFMVGKVAALVEQGRVLGLSPEEIRAYLDPSSCPKIVTKYAPKFHIYRAHFCAMWRRDMLRSALMPKVFSLPFQRKLCIKLPLVIVFLLLGYRVLMGIWSSVSEDGCLIESGPVLDELVRPLFPCKICQNLTSVPEVRDITREQFILSFGYSGLPVLVKAAAKHWKALDNFSFQYFKSLYLNNTEALELVNDQCQFFQYNTEFKSLGEALSMRPERASFQEGERPWYIGWSNCDSKIASELRQQYERPFFLPLDAESSSLDWIFMGGSGVGAGVHIDKVELPSWQAQVSGTKTWSLLPSPECSSICPDLQITVYKGDILVVDTNAWYHSTFVHPGEISITIGSEYD